MNNGAIINPTLPNSISTKTLVVNEEIRPIEQLSFDVAVTASEESGIDGQAKAGISIFGAKVGAATNAKTENVSRISFAIPVIFPASHVKTPQELAKERRLQRPSN